MKKNLAKIAPMGWNSWDCYGASVTEDIVRGNAEFMAKHLKEFGWEYVVVDIQWYEPNASTHWYTPFAPLCMDEYSRLLPAENRFPSSAGGQGFAPLADYIHSLGLKFGIHIMRGIPRQAAHKGTAVLGTDETARDVASTRSICLWNTDMYGINTMSEGAQKYYDSIFELYASWGVDFVKCDDICREMPHCEEELRMIAKAIENCGRDIVLSLSPGPALPEKSELYKETANMWRITDDFWDDWRLLYEMFERAKTWSIHTGAGHWPDADMLPIGPIRLCDDPNHWTQFTQDEQRTMMTLWSIFRSPLMIGGEMTGFDEFTMSLLTNARILEMHKNARHSHEVWRRVHENGETILWTAAHAEKLGQYVAVFNAGEEDDTVTLDLSDLELDGKKNITDLWSGKSYVADGIVTLDIRKHDAVALLIE